jgi:hypothetical protein
MNEERKLQNIVEEAGAEFVHIKDGLVVFRAGPNEGPISLYPDALRSTEDVRLALKNYRERQHAQTWELSERKVRSQAELLDPSEDHYNRWTGQPHG